MGKIKCCKKKSSCINYNDSSSSSHTNSHAACVTSSSSFTNSRCCPKYPKCCCVINKCAPIYYPNNYVGQYPCIPSNPCNPCNPCIPPYPLSQCGIKYTSSNTIITNDSTLSVNSQNVFICNPTTNITLTLPSISSLGSCGYTKMFVISNISSTNTVSFSANVPDTLTTSPIVLGNGDSVTLYSVYISTGSYWVVA